jgi:predicted metal-dependent HD superfamily phosphohydrolase
MPKRNVYLPQELESALRGIEAPVSQICQDALWGWLKENRPQANIEKLYAEPHRHYHTWQHIEECMAWLPRVEPVDEQAVREALLIHDAVYDPMRNDNEKRSAALATSQEVAELVMWTDHSRTDVPGALDSDAKLVHDIDLAILGAHPARFREYQEQIRKEYEHVPDHLYVPGRQRVLQGFVSMERIYYSNYFHKRLDTLARENLYYALHEEEA